MTGLTICKSPPSANRIPHDYGDFANHWGVVEYGYKISFRQREEAEIKFARLTFTLHFVKVERSEHTSGLMLSGGLKLANNCVHDALGEQ